MVHYHTIVFIATIICILTCMTNVVSGNTDDFKQTLLQSLRFKRKPCEIRDPFTGGCAVPGPRSPFKRNLNNELDDILINRERKKRAPCEIRNPFTGGCAVPGPRNPF